MRLKKTIETNIRTILNHVSCFSRMAARLCGKRSGRWKDVNDLVKGAKKIEGSSDMFAEVVHTHWGTWLTGVVHISKTVSNFPTFWQKFQKSLLQLQNRAASLKNQEKLVRVGSVTALDFLARNMEDSEALDVTSKRHCKIFKNIPRCVLISKFLVTQIKKIDGDRDLFPILRARLMHRYNILEKTLEKWFNLIKSRFTNFNLTLIPQT